MDQPDAHGNAPVTVADQADAGTGGFVLPPIAQVPAGWTFAALAIGLGGGLALAFLAPAAMPRVLAVAGPVGELWLRALQATIVPLVAALIFTGVFQTVRTASAGGMARRSLGWFVAVLAFAALIALIVPTALLALVPVPESAAAALRAGLGGTVPAGLPGIADYLRSIVPANVIDAAANDHMLPLILFMSVFALAVTRLVPAQRDLIALFFAALAGAMLVVIGWVLALAPLGVLALSLTSRRKAARPRSAHWHIISSWSVLQARSCGSRPIRLRRWLRASRWAGLRAISRRCRYLRCRRKARSHRCRQCWARASGWACAVRRPNSSCRSRLHCFARPARR
jgi:hypothetical protein